MPFLPGWSDPTPCVSEAEYYTELERSARQTALLDEGRAASHSSFLATLFGHLGGAHVEAKHRQALNCDGTVHVKGDGKPMKRTAYPRSFAARHAAPARAE